MSNLRYLPFLVLLVLLAACPLQAAPQDNDTKFDEYITAASEAQKAGNFQAAADAYQHAVAVRTDVAELWANLGLMQHQLGNYPDAMTSFRKALHLKPRLFVPNLFLGMDLIKEKEYAAGLPFLLTAEELNPSDTQAAMALGQTYSALHDPQKASAAYAKALLANDHNAQVWFGIGVMALEEVERDARVLMAKYKSSAAVDALTAEAFEEEKKPIEAAAYLGKAIAARGGPLCIQSQYALLLMQQGKSDLAAVALQKELDSSQVCPLTILVAGRLGLEQGDKAVDLKQWGPLWEINPQLVTTNDADLWKGVSASDAARMSGLLATQEGLLPHAELQVVQQDVSYPARSEARVLPVPTVIPSPHRCMSSKGAVVSTAAAGLSKTEIGVACSFYSGDYWDASLGAHAMQANSITESAGLYWEVRADQRLAVAALNRAGEEAPNSPQMHVLLGDIQRQRKHLSEAKVEYDKALALRPDDQGALLGLGVTQFLAGDLDGALKLGNRLIEGNPEDPSTNLLLGEVLVGLNRFQDAEPYLNRSLTVEPELQPRVHALLGRCYTESGFDAKAVNELKLALRNDDDGSIHYQLALLYRKTGDRADAASLFEESKRLHGEQLQRASIALQEMQQANANPSQ